MKLSGLPMVFAVWAGKSQHINERLRRIFVDSCRFGLAHLEDIFASAPATHGVASAMAREYLTRHISFELDDTDRRGLARFLELASELDPELCPPGMQLSSGTL